VRPEGLGKFKKSPHRVPNIFKNIGVLLLHVLSYIRLTLTALPWRQNRLLLVSLLKAEEQLQPVNPKSILFLSFSNPTFIFLNTSVTRFYLKIFFSEN
jgi:hypothetical protein